MRWSPRSGTVVKLGVAQTLAWASSYYLIAILALPMGRDLGLRATAVFGAFSMALVVAGLLGPLAGRLIDRHGGRPVLIGSNFVFSAGLALLACAQGPFTFYAAWALLGVAMSGGLYEAAFSTLVRLYGRDARDSITGITLIAGFASTVGWPLTALLESSVGWRGASLAWAAIHLAVALPLNAWLPRADAANAEGGPAVSGADADEPVCKRPRFTAALLGFVFAVVWFVSTAMAAHLPGLLVAAGASLATAAAVGALVGPAQVAGRLLEFGVLRRLHPLLSARLAALAHPLGALLLLGIGAPAAAAFAILHGAGNGILTIAKGTLPLAFFGAHGYGARQGRIMLAARVGQAFAPLLFGLAIERYGALALWWSVSLALGALVALFALPSPRAGWAAGVVRG